MANPSKIRYLGQLYVLDDTKFDDVAKLKKVTEDKAKEVVDDAKKKAKK